MSSPTSSAGRFASQVAMITGASNQGIGGAAAERLADEGAAVVLVTPDEPKLLIKRLNRAKREFFWADCDVTRQAGVRQAVDDCRARFGKIDVLVNNAGVELARPLEEFTDEEWERLLEVNLAGAIRITRAALPCLNEPGVIINVSSALALGGCPGFSVYGASKAGLNALTQALAWELAPRRIRVVGVAPGLVHTPMLHKYLQRWDIAHVAGELQRQIRVSQPLGMGMPHDIAAVIAFLASREARLITGVTIPVGWAHGYPLPALFTDLQQQSRDKSRVQNPKESRVERPESRAGE